MKLSKEQLHEASIELFRMLCEGMEDAEAMGALGVEPGEYVAVKQAMFELKADELRAKPTEHVYVEYLINQMANIKDLTDMISYFASSRQHAPFVGAVKARSDILDKLIARGQEFGLIRREPDKKMIVGGVVVANLSNEELKRTVARELRELNRLVRESGDVDFLALEAGPTHHGPALPKVVEATAVAEPTKTARAKTSRTSAKARGRRKQRM